ncbi:ribosomal protein S18-alanine N-acetyltransferase [Agromyces sp. LHK192]|uniref:ribosomal protein S18-alanine N-acetyltransferase n=1 Tax=Agromyces sp. LHK192 TaxID=2498704 RepID=UPI000FD81245|nr:ribosomal protein S18-alanine N-acetyltransferase [Agromyces sp. LHK192]
MSRMLRRAGIADLDGIMAIERATFPEDAWSDEMMRRELEQEHGHYLVVVDDEEPGTVLAYAGLLAARGSGEGDIQTIAVDERLRGLGIGRALMQAQVAEARRRGAERLFLEVRADNEAAHRLYRSLGFVDLAVRPRYYRDGADAVSMRLDIPPVTTTTADAPGAPAAAATAVDRPVPTEEAP